MDHLKEFFESSTIHGLSQISRARGFLKWFWIFTVFSCFVGAGVMIFYSFDVWHSSPVTTTIDTLTISKIKIPKIKVCPPKHTYTNLNYDVLKIENATLDNTTRQELLSFAFLIIDDAHHNEIMNNLSTLEEADRYYNWYYGKSNLLLPKYQLNDGNSYLENVIETVALSGCISTPYFGEQYKVGRVEEGRVRNWVQVLVPKNFHGNPNITLHFLIDWVASINLHSIRLDWEYVEDHSKTFSPPLPFVAQEPKHDFEVHYRTLNEHLKTFKKMPGFNFSWYYSGVDAAFSNSVYSEIIFLNKNFVR